MKTTDKKKMPTKNRASGLVIVRHIFKKTKIQILIAFFIFFLYLT